ncbi:hypothetical protein K501DRAFT_331092 [Backusella circina FSU 941]|nr:hypothetical protein K501DRAFT_331092 [Backusella circina FSU 941]
MSIPNPVYASPSFASPSIPHVNPVASSPYFPSPAPAPYTLPQYTPQYAPRFTPAQYTPAYPPPMASMQIGGPPPIMAQQPYYMRRDPCDCCYADNCCFIQFGDDGMFFSEEEHVLQL